MNWSAILRMTSELRLSGNDGKYSNGTRRFRLENSIKISPIWTRVLMHAYTHARTIPRESRGNVLNRNLSL